ncbi:helicase related [Anaeramoeba flamelloides]|uniref:Helicase related n=1 Tax=Anaeramoeba flamelloides TaxID=1746091 RepID=A0ABQ8Y152_9EUKA|nr:helicase related [Anaeramoeba flamelloides]
MKIHLFFVDLFQSYCSCFLLVIIFFLTLLFPLYLPEPGGIKLQPQNEANQVEIDTNELKWFTQVTDTHLSLYNQTSFDLFEQFCHKVLPLIKPFGVIHTGDIVSGVVRSFLRRKNQQELEEWKKYKQVIEDSKILGDPFWLDLRGNHDSSAILSMNDTQDYFYSYLHTPNKEDEEKENEKEKDQEKEKLSNVVNSKQTQHKLFHSKEIVFQNNRFCLTFLTLDLNPYPSISGPLGFYGQINGTLLNDLEAFFQQRKENKKSRQSKCHESVLLFTHQPMFFLDTNTKFPKDPSLDFKTFLVNSPITFILNGHYHQRNIYSRIWSSNSDDRSGLIELELADFGHKQHFRVFAIDNGFFSFADSDMREFLHERNPEPIILITNPKDSRFLVSKEPISNLINFEQIRVLIFATQEIEKVQFSIDSQTLRDLRLSNKISHLYLAEYNPKDYSTGIHNLTIRVIDQSGNTFVKNQQFSLDGTTIYFSQVTRDLATIKERN